MPRAKKGKTPAQCQAQYTRTTNKTSKWRGKTSTNYKTYKRKTKKKEINKIVNKIVYQDKNIPPAKTLTRRIL